MFQAVLPDYQLVVVSGDHFNAIIYKGPETEKPIYLYYHSGHYDLITSMPAFLGRVRKRLQHRGLASCFHHTVCSNQGEISSWILCAQCYRMFKGPGCFENHQRVGVIGGNSVCQTYTKCQKCGKVADVSEGEHKCGENRCPTCQKYDNP